MIHQHSRFSSFLFPSWPADVHELGASALRAIVHATLCILSSLDDMAHDHAHGPICLGSLTFSSSITAVRWCRAICTCNPAFYARTSRSLPHQYFHHPQCRPLSPLLFTASTWTLIFAFHLHNFFPCPKDFLCLSSTANF